MSSTSPTFDGERITRRTNSAVAELIKFWKSNVESARSDSVRIASRTRLSLGSQSPNMSETQVATNDAQVMSTAATSPTLSSPQLFGSRSRITSTQSLPPPQSLSPKTVTETPHAMSNVPTGTTMNAVEEDKSLDSHPADTSKNSPTHTNKSRDSNSIPSKFVLILIILQFSF